MNYTISKTKDYVLIKVSGNIDRANVISAGSFIRELNIIFPETVIVDIDGLEDEREMFFHVALINIFKKEIELAGGIFKVRASGFSIRNYLEITGLDKIFPVDDPAAFAGKEADNRDCQRC